MWRDKPRTGSAPWGHIYCVIAGVIALLVFAWVLLTLLHHGGYYVRPFDNGGP